MADAMLRWIQQSLSDYDGLVIEDLSSSWNDGRAFCGVVEEACPGTITVGELSPENRSDNIKLAFEKAEGHLGYPPTAESAEDVLAEASVSEDLVLSFLYAFSDALPLKLDEFEKADESLKLDRSSTMSCDVGSLPVMGLGSLAGSLLSGSRGRLCVSIESESALDDDTNSIAPPSPRSGSQPGSPALDDQESVSDVENPASSSQPTDQGNQGMDEQVTAALPAGDSKEAAAASQEPVADGTTTNEKNADDKTSDEIDSDGKHTDETTVGDAVGAEQEPVADGTPTNEKNAVDKTSDENASDGTHTDETTAGDTVGAEQEPSSNSDSAEVKSPECAGQAMATSSETAVETKAPSRPEFKSSASICSDGGTTDSPRTRRKKGLAPKPPGPDGTIRPQPMVPPGYCNLCNELVFEMERQEVEGVLIHRKCLRCHVCKKILQEQSYEVANDRLTCQHHYRIYQRRLQSVSEDCDAVVMPSLSLTAIATPPDGDLKEDVQTLKKELDIKAGSIRRKRAPAIPLTSPAMSRAAKAVVGSTSSSPISGSPISGSPIPQKKKSRAPLPPGIAASNCLPQTGTPPGSLHALPKQQEQRRRKPKAPPPPDVKQRHRQYIIDDEELSLEDIEKKMAELDHKQRVLEEVAAQLENILTESSDKDSATVELVQSKMAVLKGRKAELVADENYLVYLRMDLELVKERNDLEATLRTLLAKDSSELTEADHAQQQAMVDEVVAIVEERNRLLECLSSPEEDQVAAKAQLSTQTSVADIKKEKKDKKEKKEQKEESKRLEKERKEEAKRKEKEQKEEAKRLEKEQKEQAKRAEKEHKEGKRVEKQKEKGLKV